MNREHILTDSNEIGVWLTPEEAQKFRIFMDNYNFFNALMEAEVYKGDKPQYILYFNKFGILKNIEAKEVVYTQDLHSS